MCLLVTQSADTRLDDALLRGVYRKNSDGVGVMWAEDGALHYKKAMPQSEDEFVAFYHENIKGKNCAWHARMRTHGDINMENCHPYPVFGFEGGDAEHPMLLMHNGILSTGNTKDTTKSDTWHYIRDYLRPILADTPKLLLVPAFQKLVESHIGSGNKFVLMDYEGNTVTLNKSRGVEYNGAWFSNTYAWDYPKKAKTTPVIDNARLPAHWEKALRESFFNRPAPAGKPKYAPSKADVTSFFKDLKAFDAELWKRTPYSAGDALFAHLGAWNAEDFMSKAANGEISKQKFEEGLKDPRKAEQYLDEADIQKSFSFQGAWL